MLIANHIRRITRQPAVPLEDARASVNIVFERRKVESISDPLLRRNSAAIATRSSITNSTGTIVAVEKL
jgi:hypothetical protein